MPTTPPGHHVRMKTRKGRWTPLVAVPAMLVALAGCSDDDGGDDEPRDSAETASDSPSASETSTPPTITPPDTPVPPTVGKAAGALDDIEWDPASCSTEPGEQSVSGTLTNSTDRATGYLVQISWTTATSDTLGLGYDVVRGAEPGEETEWEITADVPEGVTQCVIFAQRGVIKKG
jgi:hypothetical protein